METELIHKVELLNSELSKIIPDFKMVEEKIPLVDSNYTYFSYIFRELKEFFAKEIAKTIEPISFEIKKINDAAEQQKNLNKFKLKEIDNSLESLKAKIDNMSIDLNTHTNRLDTIGDTIENMKEDILYRATYNEYNSLVSTVETKASTVELEESNAKINAELYYCVKVQNFEDLKDSVRELREESKQLSTIKLMKETVNELKENVNTELNNYITTKVFSDYKEDVFYLFKDVNLKQERQENIQGFTNDAFRKEMAQLDKAVKKRPWRKDIEIFRMNLQEAAKIIELQKHKENIIENLDEFKAIISSFGKRCDNYEKVLERFDEIVLEKASKDDMSQLKLALLPLAKSEDVEYLKDSTRSEISFIQSQFDETLEKFARFEQVMVQVNASFRNFKSDNKDNIQIKNTLADLQNAIDSKAEKIDILALGENVTKKEEFNNIRNVLDVVKRQLEMHVAIEHSVLKTMIKSNDSAATKNKQRLELLRNMNNLMNWAGLVGLESISKEPTLHSGIFQKSYKEIEQSLLLPYIKHPRKNSVSDLPVHNNTVEIPKFKGKYDI